MFRRGVAPARIYTHGIKLLNWSTAWLRAQFPAETSVVNAEPVSCGDIIRFPRLERPDHCCIDVEQVHPGRLYFGGVDRFEETRLLATRAHNAFRQNAYAHCGIDECATFLPHKAVYERRHTNNNLDVGDVSALQALLQSRGWDFEVRNTSAESNRVPCEQLKMWIGA
eukprot:1684648-Prymnesium_polylepis.1